MINIVIPKGSHEKQILLLLQEAGLTAKKTASQHDEKIEGPKINRVMVVHAQEIPTYVEQKYFDLGITGLEWVEEYGSDVVLLADLPYGKQGADNLRIVIAVSPSDNNIKTGGDIKPNSKVSTEYPNLTKAYFEKLGIPVEIFRSQGPTEAKPTEPADVVVDVSEADSIALNNGFKIVDVIMESTTKLIANKESWEDPTKRKEIEEIRTLMLAGIDAGGKVLTDADVQEDEPDNITSPGTEIEEISFDILEASLTPDVSTQAEQAGSPEATTVSGGPPPEKSKPVRKKSTRKEKKMPPSENKFQIIVEQMKEQLPGALATGIFSITDGLMLAVDSDVPDTNMEAMSASHVRIWDNIKRFMELLPSEISGGLHSMILELEGLTFYMACDRGYQIALMGACDTTTGNLGLLRIITKRYLNKTMLAITNM